MSFLHYALKSIANTYILIQYFRSATLEDIYRHYGRSKKIEDESDDDTEEEEYDTNIAGYPFQMKHSQSSKVGSNNIFPYTQGPSYNYAGPSLQSGQGYSYGGVEISNLGGSSQGIENAMHITHGAIGSILLIIGNIFNLYFIFRTH